ncbi:MAG: hypothetical protein GX558_11120, partial [Clostridiales bacterium]|nr:hypothetical protein [Clostridiales bacterium]
MEPFFSIWFGNFYEPAYGDRAFVDESLRRIRAMGFDQVMLDSKVWQDFQDRFAGKEASPYVAMQEYMMAAIKRAGLRHSFLALYMNGDNLYPHIRFSPPVYREGITGPDGRKQPNYKYWSPLDQQLMAEHVAGLMRLYGDNHAVVREGEQERLPICSMWDPVATPSFDEEGVRAYRGYLANLGLTSEAEDPRDDWFFWRYRDDPSLTGRDVLEGSDKY